MFEKGSTLMSEDLGVVVPASDEGSLRSLLSVTQ